MMGNVARVSLVFMSALALFGCATGPKYAEVKSSIPSLSAEKGRIYFYRSGTMFGSGIQPSVRLNGGVVGESKPGGFFYVDVPPGDYEVVLSTEVEKKLTFVLERRQEKCVRMSVGLGVLVYRVYPELVEPTVCSAELQEMSYTGPPPTLAVAPPAPHSPPLNLRPMYGYPDIAKSPAEKEADEKFIASAVAASGSRREASMEFAAEGWRSLKAGDLPNAMRRLNQAWLLNPDNYMAHWGFGALMMRERKPAEAVAHYDSALSLVGTEAEKPRLLADAGRAYSARAEYADDRSAATKFFGKANALFGEATALDPRYGNAYRAWAMSLYDQGDYARAWEMVRKARSAGADEFHPSFLDALSRRMPQPK